MEYQTPALEELNLGIHIIQGGGSVPEGEDQTLEYDDGNSAPIL